MVYYRSKTKKIQTMNKINEFMVKLFNELSIIKLWKTITNNNESNFA